MHIPKHLSLIALAGLLTAVVPAQSSEEKSSSMAPAINAVSAVEDVIVERVYANGIISAVEEVLVQPQVEGLAVNALMADIGDSVEAGSVLAKLSDDQLVLQHSQFLATRAKAVATIAQLRAQLAETEANADEATKNSTRASTLAAKGTFSRVQAEQAETQAVGAKARVRSMLEAINVAEAEIALVDAQIRDVELRLGRTEVKAPVTGLVTARGARIGAIASAGSSPLFTLIRDGELELRADVAEADILKLKNGQEVVINVTGADRPRKGVVRLVEPTLSTTTRLGTIRVRIIDPEGLRAGMFAQAEIIIRRRSGVIVPLTSVSIGHDGADVLLLTDGRARMTRIKTGIRDGGRIEVLEGLAPGDLIVAKAGAFVRDGDRVNPVVKPKNGAPAAITE